MADLETNPVQKITENGVIEREREREKKEYKRIALRQQKQEQKQKMALKTNIKERD